MIGYQLNTYQWFHIQKYLGEEIDSWIFGVFAKLKRLKFNLLGSWLSEGVSHFSIIPTFPKSKEISFWQSSREFCKIAINHVFCPIGHINCSLFVAVKCFFWTTITFRSLVLHLNFHLQLGSFNYSTSARRHLWNGAH